MNVLDITILIALTALGYWWFKYGKYGLIRSVFALVGFWTGFFISTLLTPLVINYVGNLNIKITLFIILIFGGSIFFSYLGGKLGKELEPINNKWKLKRLDRSLGVVGGIIMTIFGLWLISGIIISLPFRNINNQINNSVTFQTINQVMPPAPVMIDRISAMIGDSQLSEVLFGAPLRPVEIAEIPSDEKVLAVVEYASDSTVRIESTVCKDIMTGSGFVVADNLIATNAHVVAGNNNPQVIDLNGRRAGEVIYFDADLDLAFVRADNLAGNPLETSRDTHSRGATAAILGYPGGERLQAEPAYISRDIQARGLNIYREKLATRHMYELQTSITTGYSGGPLVLPTGEVIGMVTARSETEEDVGYAILTKAINDSLKRSQAMPYTIDAGECI
ncbi:MAG: MarP family serine protease [Candidatus Saccharimonadales bacterium]